MTIYALPAPSGGRPILRDTRITACPFRPGECPRLLMRAGHIDPVFGLTGQAGPAERAWWSPWPVTCSVSVEHGWRPRTSTRCTVAPRT